ncbi:helix-turn-helix domain-containing protein [Xanthomonas cassavae CFBP 4642]|uniref:Helix-turn-helix domain-containing protein n=1 Tax=Xanthomonas cassavae CFBP 4642 TaxID=1219375 RepID=A0ABS8HFK8_9XANT|nr:helix-turn-helix domain-containing protein [Xanthomonas cassavae]MCC4620971.1 helix-turn-helix domain-containing protein [Xanthomonas cassavae CFBP 4642]
MTISQTPSLTMVQSVNRALDYIEVNLAGKLSLSLIAGAACVSPFHLQRIFRAVVGETPRAFVLRRRLENALGDLSHQPGRPLTEIALARGFSSLSDFSRNFRRHFGYSPAKLDLGACLDARRSALDATLALTSHGDGGGAPNAGEFSVNLRDNPERTVQYVRVHRPFDEGAVGAAALRLLSWARDAGVAHHQWIGYLWDQPRLACADDCRYDVAVEVAHGRPYGDIGLFRFPPMKVAEVVIRGDLQLEARAFTWLRSVWLPASGYLPADLPAFEAWLGLPYAHGNDHFELACQLPIRSPSESNAWDQLRHAKEGRIY